MDNIKFPQLPFLTREMLKFGNKSSFELKVRVIAHTAWEDGFKVRGLTRSGFFSIACSPLTGGGTQDTFTLKVSDIPIFVSAVDAGSSIAHGDVFVSISLTVAEDFSFELCSGFISVASGISYPSASLNQTSPGQGFLKSISVSDPAAGAEITHDFDIGSNEKIHCVTFKFVTDANVANRRVHLYFTDTGSLDARPNFFGADDQPASTTRYYTFAPFGYIPDRTDDDDILVPLPVFYTNCQDGQLNSDTTNIQAGDQFSLIRVKAEVFPLGVT